MVPMPIVIAKAGWLSEASKKRAFLERVFSVSVLTLVLDLKLEVGSLKPMCPFAPIPRS